MFNRKRKTNTPVILIALILIIAAGAVLKNYAAGKVLSGFTDNTVEMDKIDLKYEPNPTLYFSKACGGIKMGVTNDQAFSIREALTKEAFSRPLTHDLFVDVLNSYNAKLVYAKIDAIQNGVYTAKLLFSDGSTLHEADSRPSDMAALTLRYGNKFAISGDIISNMTDVC
ncbi:MAG: bifunctional nuclease family protein [Candidatus Aenigmarchaeota archaeon]|nr:bifunctional nuclease family protein [Candidatus Aenigmarchaeota archaeon]